MDKKPWIMNDPVNMGLLAKFVTENACNIMVFQNASLQLS